MNTKKRILALLLGFTIIFNVSLCNYHRVNAVVGVDDAVISALVITLLAAAGMYVNQLQGDDANQIAQDFLGYCIDYNSNLYSKILSVASDPKSIIFSAADMMSFYRTFNEFIGEKFDPDTCSVEYPFTVQTIATGNVNFNALVSTCNDFYKSYYGVSADNPWFANSRSGLPIFDLNTNRYITIVGHINYANNFNYDYLGVVACPNGYLDIRQRSSNQLYELNSGYGRVFPVNDVTNMPYYGFDLSKITILGQFYYTPDAEPNISTGGTENKNIAVNPLSSLKMGVENFFSKIQDKFKINDVTGEAETTLDPSGELEKVANGEKSFDDYVAELDPEKVLAPERTVPAYDPAAVDDPAVDVPAGSEAVAITNTAAVAAAFANTYGKGNVNMSNFKINKDLSTTFPFSLPWDIMRILNIFRADPQAPVFEFDFSGYYPFNQVPARYSDNLVFRLDLSDFDAIIKVEKFFITLSYAIFLITITRSKMIRG